MAFLRRSAAAVAVIAQLSTLCAKKQSQRRPPIIQQAGDPETEEKVMSYDPSVLKLSEKIFEGNVLRDDYERVHTWVVLYSLPWFEPCSLIAPHYSTFASRWEGQLNNESTFSLRVRFATVDCSTDKPLCNQMDVDNFPTVRLYRQGQAIATWTGGQRSQQEANLARFLHDKLSNVSTSAEAEQHGQTVGQALVDILPNPSDVSTIIIHGTAQYMSEALIVLLILGLNVWILAWSTKCLRQPKVIEPVGRAGGLTGNSTTSVQEADGIQRLMPEEWLRHRRPIEHSIEL